MVKDKVVFITGAASGIGYKLAIEFLKEGSKVVFSDLNEEKLKEVVNGQKDKGFDCIGLTCDVTNEKQLTKSLDQAIGEYGRIDVLINNAGMQHVASLEEFPTETFEHMIKIMLVAPFMASKHIFPMMKKQGFGRIINKIGRAHV